MIRAAFQILLAAVLAIPALAMAATVEYIHTDALGSPVAVTNSAGQVIERREYEPYGRQLTPAALTNGPGYTGHVTDAVTGLTYMQQRYYDPSIGRFLSIDPEVPDRNNGNHFNRYRYADNNPYRYTDPDGRCANLCTAGVGAAVGAIVGFGIEAYKQVKAGEFNGRALAVETGKGAVVGGLIGLTGGAAAAPASGLTLAGQAAATSSVGMGVGAGAHALGEVAKGNPVPSAQESIRAGYATALAGAAGPALGPVTKSATTTVAPAVASHPVTSLSGKVFNTVNVPAQTINRPVAAELANNAAGSAVEEMVKEQK